MRRMVHHDRNGFIRGTTRIYNDNEKCNSGEYIWIVLWGVIAIGGLLVIVKMLAPLFE